jgi:REP-associated tyrosine transposase
MPRGPRLDEFGALHHVMARGIERRPIFLCDRDREDLVDRLERNISACAARAYAWALMPNHFHLLIQTGPVSLSSLMRRVLTGFVVSFNRRHDRVGHLFQNRFKSILVEHEPYLLELVRYIHLNPVRAHLVSDIDALDRYPWTGHSALMGRRHRSWQDTESVLARFGSLAGRARRAYREFVLNAWTEGRRPELCGGGLVRSAGGLQQVEQLVRGRERWCADERVLGSSEFVSELLERAEQQNLQRAQYRTSSEQQMGSLIVAISEDLHLSANQVNGGSRHSPIVVARAWVSLVAVRQLGLPATAVARQLGVSVQSVLRGVKLGARMLAEDGRLPQRLLTSLEIRK